MSGYPPDDPSCRDKPLLQLNTRSRFPGMHFCAPWAVRPWPIPSTPVGLKPDAAHQTVHEWLAPMRERGANKVDKYSDHCHGWRSWSRKLTQRPTRNVFPSTFDSPTSAMVGKRNRFISFNTTQKRTQKHLAAVPSLWRRMMAPSLTRFDQTGLSLS